MKYSISPDRRFLTITADDGERANLRDLGDKIRLDSTLCDCLEHITCNSELSWVYPEETGDLTNAPMLGIRDDEQSVTERWAHMDYQIISFLEVLRDKGEIVLTGGN